MMVVMGTVCTSQVKARSPVTKVNLFNDLKVTQQFESSVYGSQSNLRELLLNQEKYFLCAEMILFMFKQYTYSNFPLLC
ncbi:hypothetical protein D3C76_1542190 [compost metagenome]